MITGEYAVLDGADALAIPTKWGQRMTIRNHRGSDLLWESFDADGTEWFSATISLYDFSSLRTSDQKVSDQLQELLKNAVRLNPEFLDKWNGFKVSTFLEFNRNWGLGSSSTLVHLVAQWADVHPLELYFKTYNGSGYDVACAGVDTPIVYYNDQDEIGYTPVEFDPPFAEQLYFVHLGVKKNSQDAVKHYLKSGQNRKNLVKQITEITEEVLQALSLDHFVDLIQRHESLISQSIGADRIQNTVFKGFEGGVKSLGAWGGDFVLVASKQSEAYVRSFCAHRGLNTIIPFQEMVYKTGKIRKVTA